MTFDTRAALIERIVAVYTEERRKWLSSNWNPTVDMVAGALRISDGRFRRWLAASPDLRAALVAEGLSP